MSKRQHQQQLQRARDRRRAAALDRKQRRTRVTVLTVVGLLVLALVVGLAVAGGTGDGDAPAIDPVEDDPVAEDPADEAPIGEEPEEPQAADAPCPPAEETPEPRTEPYDEPPRFDVDADTTYVVVLETSCGDLEIELDQATAPRTAENFLALTEDGYYTGVPFHRTIEGFMAQGGDPTGTGTGCVDQACETRLPGYEFEDELAGAEALPEHPQGQNMVVYPRGAVAMANSGPDTQGSQFFIVHEDAPLPPAYTVFGELVSGDDVLDDIVAGPVTGPAGDLAVDPVVVLATSIETR